MGYYVRKFTKSKWTKTDEVNKNELSSDACTSCLRTSSNKLSLWEINDLKSSSLEEVVLALVTSLDKIDRMQLLYFEKKHLAKEKVVKSSGDTPIKELKEKHSDLTEITYPKLDKIVDIYIASIENGYIKKYSKKEVEQIVNKAILDKRLVLEDTREIKNINIRKLLGDNTCVKCGSEVV
ncbi:hypothetical protein OQE61_07445 [Cetobacterium somerae]|uniref:hypothetical protein n=1 Tax=Cetobacterium somerae TaxID=188913 RepID=UPI00225A949E|nr:hypothetical protein [Cetobacterium somerae]MCX3067326.1 hypothetical protein [Cetobacterium somerae]